MSFRRILTVVLAVLLLVGCSGGGNSGETPEPERKVLRVGMECNYAPFNWTTTTPGEHTVAISSVDYADGFDVVIASMLAEKIGMDPFDIRYINVAREGDLNVNQKPFREYPMEGMMDRLKPIYEEAKEQVAEWNKDHEDVKKGVGIAWGGYNVGLGGIDEAHVAIELMPDGTFRKYDTWQEQGQGGDQGSLICTLEALKPYFPPPTTSSSSNN